MLLGFHTHPWHEVLKVVSLAGIGFAIAWQLSKSITQRYGLARNNLIYTIRTAILMLLTASAMYLYFLIPLEYLWSSWFGIDPLINSGSKTVTHAGRARGLNKEVT